MAKKRNKQRNLNPNTTEPQDAMNPASDNAELDATTDAMNADATYLSKLRTRRTERAGCIGRAGH